MKKMMILTAIVAMAAMFSPAQVYEKCIQPNTNNVATFENTYCEVGAPVLIYTDLTGTTTNAVTLKFIAETATNSADYGKAYPVGSFSTIGGAEVPIVLNDSQATNSAGSVILRRGAVLRLEGSGATASTNVYYRIVFKAQ